MHAQLLSHVQLFSTPWIVADQAPLSLELARQEFWSELPFPPPGNLPNLGIEPLSLALADGFFTTEQMANGSVEVVRDVSCLPDESYAS